MDSNNKSNNPRDVRTGKTMFGFNPRNGEYRYRRRSREQRLLADSKQAMTASKVGVVSFAAGSAPVSACATKYSRLVLGWRVASRKAAEQSADTPQIAEERERERERGLPGTWLDSRSR